ncbi:MAG: vWA domain-containing protein [Balneolaceae bacterium]
MNPLFLIALLSVAIPLVIYLFNVRNPKRVAFSTLAFFDSIKNSSLRRIKIKQWLLLALRMLAVLMLVLALAQPFIPGEDGTYRDGEPTAVAILIDNSPGMAQVDRGGPYIEQAKAAALTVLDTVAENAQVMVDKTNGRSLQLPFMSAAAVRSQIQSLETENRGSYMGQRISSAIGELKRAAEPNKILYVFSDMSEAQFRTMEEMSFQDEASVHLRFVKIGEASPSNVGFDGVEISVDGEDILLRASVRNFGAQTAANQFISLEMAGELLLQQPYSIPAGEAETFLFTVPRSDERYMGVELVLEGDEHSFDNRFYAAISLPEQKRVLVVRGDDSSDRGFRSYLRPLLDAATADNRSFEVDYRTLSSLSPNELLAYDAVVLDGVRSLPDFLIQPLINHVQENGAGLLLLPSADGTIASYNRLLGSGNAGRYRNVRGSYGSFQAIDRLAPPREGHPILDAVFDRREDEEIRVNAPELFYYLQMESGDGRNTVPILFTATGSPVLIETQVGNGTLIYSAIGADPGWSNFPVKPIFAPIFFRTVNYLVGGRDVSLRSQPLGTPFQVQVSTSSPGEIELEVDGESILPEVRQTFSGLDVSYAGEEWGPGWVFLKENDQKDLYAVNADAMESTLRALGKNEIDDVLADYFSNATVLEVNAGGDNFIEQIGTASFSRDLWNLFILIAFILLIAETLVSRIFKAESIQ